METYLIRTQKEHISGNGPPSEMLTTQNENRDDVKIEAILKNTWLKRL